jgi:DNA-binding MarR family transcriptional regulator
VTTPSAPAPSPGVAVGDTAELAPEVLAARLRLANARLARRVRQEAMSGGDDLTASRLAALVTVEALGPVTLGELAAVEQVQPPSMTRIVARLEENGLARREVDANDRRIVRVRITDAGRQTLARSRTRKAAFLAKRVARLTPEERTALADALPVLEQLIDD